MALNTAVSGIAITGIAETPYVRGTETSALEKMLQASLDACRDAGIEPSAIDGLVVPSGAMQPEDFLINLGISDLRFHAGLNLGGAGPAACVAVAAKAIDAGMAERVLIPVAWNGYTGMRLGSGAAGLSGDPNSMSPGPKPNLEQPYGTVVPMQWYSMHANRYFHETKADPLGMERFALSTRKHANLNPRAVFHDRVLTSEVYRASPVLVKPFHLYDISLETDGGAAIIVERAKNSNSTHKPVYVAGGGEGHPEESDTLSSRTDILDMGLAKVARRVFADLGMRPDEADFAEIYDCFTFIALRQMEELGLCARGEAPDFAVESRIGPGGSFPVNTHGGLLSHAHLLGMNHIVEAVRQLRGTAGAGQVPGAHIGLVTGYGDFSNGSLAVLHN